MSVHWMNDFLDKNTQLLTTGKKLMQFLLIYAKKHKKADAKKTVQLGKQIKIPFSREKFNNFFNTKLPVFYDEVLNFKYATIDELVHIKNENIPPFTDDIASPPPYPAPPLPTNIPPPTMPSTNISTHVPASTSSDAPPYGPSPSLPLKYFMSDAG